MRAAYLYNKCPGRINHNPLCQAKVLYPARVIHDVQHCSRKDSSEDQQRQAAILPSTTCTIFQHRQQMCLHAIMLLLLLLLLLLHHCCTLPLPPITSHSQGTREAATNSKLLITGWQVPPLPALLLSHPLSIYSISHNHCTQNTFNPIKLPTSALLDKKDKG